MRKTSVLSAAAAFALAGTTLFGGAALAGDGDEYNTGGAGGKGGDAKAECFLPIAASVGLLHGNGGDVNQCNAVGGDGGAGGAVTDD
jgi:hypothetical protein